MKEKVLEILNFLVFCFQREKVPHYNYILVNTDELNEEKNAYELIPLADFIVNDGYWTTDMSRTEKELEVIFNGA